ncbi:hypothetical protein SFRURICE_015235 [Spodoptera frugiperda]|nr:hypothetical protein SFRURICE_015235 [Spodoptera frugiperda]
MVCVPCFVIPVLLFLWHKFIQPYVLRFWNPWAVKDADGNVKTEFPFKCEGGVCAFSRKKDDKITKDNDANQKELSGQTIFLLPPTFMPAIPTSQPEMTSLDPRRNLKPGPFTQLSNIFVYIFSVKELLKLVFIIVI